MDLLELSNFVKAEFLSSPIFPYRTGNLKRNFFDVNGFSQTDNIVTQTILSSPDLLVGKRGTNYGKLLQFAPSIRRGFKKKGYIYKYKRKPNIHFRYINRIIDNEIVGKIENNYGVKLWEQ